MQSIFSVPMRTNNNNEYLTGNLRLGDWIDFDLFDNFRVKIGVDQCQPGNSILLQYALYNGAELLFSNDKLIVQPGDVYIGFSNGAITADTFINASIHTNGQARYSIDVVALEKNEDFPGEPMWE